MFRLQSLAYLSAVSPALKIESYHIFFARFAVSEVGAGDRATQNVENIVQRE